MHRILIIDDNHAIHDDFAKILIPRAVSPSLAGAKAKLFGPSTSPVEPNKPRFELDSAFQGQPGIDKVAESIKENRPFSVAFVNMRMPPGLDGLQTIERLWAVNPHLQVVICSAYSDHSWEDITAKLGLSDRLLILKKPFDPLEVAQLATALSEKWSLRQQASLKLDELERLVEQRTRDLTHAALHDRLTDLPNRALLRDRLARLTNPAHPPRHFALLFLDFDRFKIVNDTLGHDAGDQLLVEIGRRLTAALTEHTPAWEESLAARHGGDEFVVLIAGPTAEKEAAAFGQILLERLSAPYNLKGYNITSTASIGIATSGTLNATPDDVLRDADTAMYHAKAAGKARCIVFDRAMHDALIERLTLEAELRGAAAHGEMILHYQPIVRVETGELHAFEALVRWNHPTHSLISPASFIPAAEDTGEIRAIGTWVLHEACRQVAQWRRDHPEFAHIQMSVNTSAKQLGAIGLITEVRRALEVNNLPPSALAIEITESSIIEDPELATQILQELVKVGVHIHMDDFGTGYTSFSYLHKLPLSVLKLDRAFMNSVSERRDYAAVVHAIVTLAHNLNITVVSEGVETTDQVATLLAIECDFGQGYLYGKPMPADAAAAKFLTAPPQAKAA